MLMTVWQICGFANSYYYLERHTIPRLPISRRTSQVINNMHLILVWCKHADLCFAAAQVNQTPCLHNAQQSIRLFHNYMHILKNI